VDHDARQLFWVSTELLELESMHPAAKGVPQVRSVLADQVGLVCPEPLGQCLPNFAMLTNIPRV
jgi:hypothetical protein